MAHKVMCRACRQYFDTDKLSVDEWIMPTPRHYYHTKCYADWKNNRTNIRVTGKPDEWYLEQLTEYLYQDLKIPVDFPKLSSQWKNFLASKKKQMTAKGIYFSMRYFYDVKHGDPQKAQGGIGIIPNIYEEATQYWINRENEQEGTIAAIIKQMEERAARPVVQIKQMTQKKKDKTKWSLDDV